MTVLSDVEKGGEPGRLHLTGAGVFIQLHPFLNVWFSGQMAHVGTPALRSGKRGSKNWGVRCVVISYPSGMFVDGTGRQAIGLLPFQSEPLYLTPEMVGLK